MLFSEQEKRYLQKKKLLENKPFLRRGKSVRAARKVNVFYRKAQVAKPVFLSYALWNRVAAEVAEQRAFNQPLNLLRAYRLA